ncbi:MAG: hypothetical protein HKN92_09775, partial [Chitinophagales bacterium]|nr:hypothetical protein [Chitinophagales bacterium]
DNALLGVDMKVDLFRSFSFYGQWLFDEFNFSQIMDRNGWWANKFAAQAGFKYIDVLKVDNLDIQMEVNLARPYTYTHNSTANYSHYNQELAHPLGANFREFISIVKYQPIQKLNLRFQYVHYMKGLDADSSNWGGDIFTNSINPESSLLNVEQEYNNSIGQGEKHKVNYAELLASYQIRHNIFADLSLHFRSEKEVETNLTDKTVFASFGLRMNMPYKRYDF